MYAKHQLNQQMQKDYRRNQDRKPIGGLGGDSAIEAQQDTLIDLRVERPSLEDRFLEITQYGAAQ